MKTWIFACTLILFFFFWGWIKSHRLFGGIISVRNIDTLQHELQTGDLIFTKAKTWSSSIQQVFFGSFINHCAMIVRHNSTLWVWDCAPSIGAYLTPLDLFLINNWHGRAVAPDASPTKLPVSYIVPHNSLATYIPSRLFVRRLKRPVDPAPIFRYIYNNIGRPYSFRSWVPALNYITGIELPYFEDAIGIFCSELVAETLQEELGSCVLSSLLPVHFWEDKISWKHGQGLLPPERIIGIPP